jgi:hypothetical protein
MASPSMKKITAGHQPEPAGVKTWRQPRDQSEEPSTCAIGREALRAHLGRGEPTFVSHKQISIRTRDGDCPAIVD